MRSLRSRPTTNSSPSADAGPAAAAKAMASAVESRSSSARTPTWTSVIVFSPTASASAVTVATLPSNRGGARRMASLPTVSTTVGPQSGHAPSTSSAKKRVLLVSAAQFWPDATPPPVATTVSVRRKSAPVTATPVPASANGVLPPAGENATDSALAMPNATVTAPRSMTRTNRSTLAIVSVPMAVALPDADTANGPSPPCCAGGSFQHSLSFETSEPQGEVLPLCGDRSVTPASYGAMDNGPAPY